MFATLLLIAAPLGAPSVHLAAADDAALTGLDPVQLCAGKAIPGEPGLELTHGRHTYRFTDEASRARFRADPERWAIQWGGGCGRMGPLSGAGSPERWSVHGGRIYIFASDSCKERFDEAPERFVVAQPELPENDEAALAAGTTWIEKAVEAHGGSEALARGVALKLASSDSKDGWSHRLELIISRSGELRHRSTWTSPGNVEPGSDVLWVLAEQSFLQEDGKVFTLSSPDQRHDLQRMAAREPIALLWARTTDDFLAIHTGQGELKGAPVENVLVRHRGLLTTLHLAADGRIQGLSWSGRPAEGVTRRVVETFESTENLYGILVPSGRHVMADGEYRKNMAVDWSWVEFPSKLPADTFVPEPVAIEAGSSEAPARD